MKGITNIFFLYRRRNKIGEKERHVYIFFYEDDGDDNFIYSYTSFLYEDECLRLGSFFFFFFFLILLMSRNSYIFTYIDGHVKKGAGW